MVDEERSFRVCVVDDHELIREGMATLLSDATGFELVGTAGTVRDGLEMLLQHVPDLAIVDVRLPDGSGLDLIRRARHAEPGIACLVVTSFPSSDAFRASVGSGAAGYVSKDLPNTALLDVMARVARGGTVLDWNGQARPEQVVARPQPRARDLIAGLTPRERRILDLITDGCTNREIAGHLHLTEKTVRNYVSNLLGKLGMRNRTQAATLMASHGRQVAHSWSSDGGL